jgi:hypothetical protein
MAPHDYSVNEQLRGLVPGASTFVPGKEKYKILDVVVIHPDPRITKHNMPVPLQRVGNLTKHVQATKFNIAEVRDDEKREMKGVRMNYGDISAKLKVGLDIEAGGGSEQTQEYDITLSHTCSLEVDVNIVKDAVGDHIQKLAKKETDTSSSDFWSDDGRLILGIVYEDLDWHVRFKGIVRSEKRIQC